MHTPNGKTLGVLQQYPNLRALYQQHCENETASDGSNKFRRTHLQTIATLQRQVYTHARITEEGPKQSAASSISFYFGGQMHGKRRLLAYEYIEMLTSIAEHISLECWEALESMAGSLLKNTTSDHLFMGVN